MKCFFGFHKWRGCKCSKCGNTRDKNHDWTNDCEKCAECGKVKYRQHDWLKESEDCEKCSRCGKTKPNLNLKFLFEALGRNDLVNQMSVHEKEMAIKQDIEDTTYGVAVPIDLFTLEEVETEFLKVFNYFLEKDIIFSNHFSMKDSDLKGNSKIAIFKASEHVRRKFLVPISDVQKIEDKIFNNWKRQNL